METVRISSQQLRRSLVGQLPIHIPGLRLRKRPRPGLVHPLRLRQPFLQQHLRRGPLQPDHDFRLRGCVLGELRHLHGLLLPIHHPRVRLLKVEAVPEVRLHQLLVRRLADRPHGLHRLPRN